MINQGKQRGGQSSRYSGHWNAPTPQAEERRALEKKRLAAAQRKRLEMAQAAAQRKKLGIAQAAAQRKKLEMAQAAYKRKQQMGRMQERNSDIMQANGINVTVKSKRGKKRPPHLDNYEPRKTRKIAPKGGESPQVTLKNSAVSKKE